MRVSIQKRNSHDPSCFASSRRAMPLAKLRCWGHNAAIGQVEACKTRVDTDSPMLCKN